MIINLTFDETVALRTFLIATVFRFSDFCEMQILSEYSSPEILGLAIKLDKIVDHRYKSFEIPVSADELWVVRECIVSGLMGLSIYAQNKETIDYNGCNFEELAKRLLVVANKANKANKANNVGQR